MDAKNGHDLEFYCITSMGDLERKSVEPVSTHKTDQDLHEVLQVFYDSNLLNMKQLRARVLQAHFAKKRRITNYFYLYLNVLVYKGWLSRHDMSKSTL